MQFGYNPQLGTNVPLAIEIGVEYFANKLIEALFSPKTHYCIFKSNHSNPITESWKRICLPSVNNSSTRNNKPLLRHRENSIIGLHSERGYGSQSKGGYLLDGSVN